MDASLEPKAEPGVGPPTCGVCGMPLGDDPDDDLDAWPSPICGECTRARQFDQTLWELDLSEPGEGLW